MHNTLCYFLFKKLINLLIKFIYLQNIILVSDKKDNHR